MRYPSKVEVDGIVIPIDTSFKTALRCLELADDTSISDEERALGLIYLLCDDIPKVNLNKLIKVLQKYLQCGDDTRKPPQKKDMDFKQDEKYILSSFIYDYGIDLESTDMHWWKFIDLLNGLSSECILSRIRDIRTMDISIYKDPKTRSRLLQARAQVALKHVPNKEEQEKIDEFERQLSNKLDDDDYLIGEWYGRRSSNKISNGDSQSSKKHKRLHHKIRATIKQISRA